MCETDYDVLCPALVNLKELAVINDAADYLIHVVSLVRIVRDDIVQCIINTAGRIGCLDEWCFFAVA